MEPFSATLIALLTSIISYIGAYLFKRRATEKRERLSSEVERLAKERWEVGVSLGPVSLRKVVETGSETSGAPSPELLKRIEEQVLSRLAASSGLTTENVQKEIDDHLAELREGLAKIESRFPEEAKLEKIASINDALLSERIDQLAKQVENLEQRVLSKWDVALTVSTIIAGIAFVVGATYAVLKIIGTGQ